MRHKASKQTTINEILAARSFASGTVNDGVVRFRNRARETGGGVARYSNFNGLKLQTYISLRVQRKGIFGAVTNRQTTFPLGRHSAGRPNTLAHAGRDQGLDSGLEGGRACPQFNASSDKNAAKTSFGLKRFSGSVRTAPPANARSPPPRMRAEARYASRLNLTLSPKENLRPLQAKPEEGSNICKNTIHAAFLPHNPFLPTLRRRPLFLLRTELWGQRTNSTHDSSSSCSSIGVKRLHIE